ncbi:DUF1330 domain-containing protein [Tateyamaria sp. Alg231-49]|uniref:DUF1330 domain-containing protein n=1 Tax=Tateyamaria sp. Alg231-49 TaxID=1922219 RepID=UPI000D55E900|nr:DUF1330 domain-containing protein [Tateyamaria sp. Alg231-49]
MTKGYWIANNLVHDSEAYKVYQKANAGPLKEYGGKFLVRAGRQVSPEGAMFPRSVVIEFPSYADPPPLNRSAPIVRKRRIKHGNQTSQAGRDCHEVAAG